MRARKGAAHLAHLALRRSWLFGLSDSFCNQLFIHHGEVQVRRVLSEDEGGRNGGFALS